MLLSRAAVLRWALLIGAVAVVAGHGSLLSPVPRNAADRNMSIFAHGQWVADARAGRPGCNCASHLGCAPGDERPEANGQPCLWFSQGCGIGCPTCTGTNGHTTQPLCESNVTSTLPRYAYTMNASMAQSPLGDATYQYNPWRAPGFAPVADACGVAGGTDVQHEGPGVAVFTPLPWAKQGDAGSAALPQGPPAATWRAGESAEVSWGIRYNHGGGYQYRLCPAGEPLTEACFQKLPLEFDRGAQQLQWNNGTRLSIPGTWVDQGTNPPGSTWSMNPIPRINWGSSRNPAGSGSCGSVPRDANCTQFPPPCAEGIWNETGRPLPWYHIEKDALADDVEGYCSGDWTDGRIVDRVLVPPSLPKGDYVLGWRWDCEETTQVWQNCADVRIV